MNAKVLSLVLVTFLVGGCSSVSEMTESVRGKIAAREEPKVKTFAAQPRVTYEAVRAAASQMGYRFLRGGPAQGEFDAVTPVGQGDNHGTARQLAMKVRLNATLDQKGTDVSIYITEIIEGDSSSRAGLATQTPLRDTPQYEVFFRGVQKALDARGEAK